MNTVVSRKDFFHPSTTDHCAGTFSEIKVYQIIEPTITAIAHDIDKMVVSVGRRKGLMFRAFSY